MIFIVLYHLYNFCMSNSKFRRHVVSRGAQCPEDDMERNVGESKLFKGVQVICSITALKLKV